MISLTEKPPDLIEMKIQMHIPQTEIFTFLQKKGYEIKAYPISYAAAEEMLLSEHSWTWHTFTATKEGEEQSRSKQFLKVFENELKELLKELS